MLVRGSFRDWIVGGGFASWGVRFSVGILVVVVVVVRIRT